MHAPGLNADGSIDCPKVDPVDTTRTRPDTGAETRRATRVSAPHATQINTKAGTNSTLGSVLANCITRLYQCQEQSTPVQYGQRVSAAVPARPTAVPQAGSSPPSLPSTNPPITTTSSQVQIRCAAGNTQIRRAVRPRQTPH
jgi:hypothetical protein